MPAYRRKWKDKKTGKIRMGSYFFQFELDGVTYKETVKTARTMKQCEEAERQFRQDLHEGRYGVKAKRQLFSTFVQEVYLPHVEQHNQDFTTGSTRRCYARILVIATSARFHLWPLKPSSEIG